jgi:hypothetical protein
MGRGNSGKMLIPLIRKHLKDADPEVRQRIGVVLDKIGAGSDVGGGAAPVPPHLLVHPRILAPRQFGGG